ncbi:hypothetical protein L6452_13706 [Arctium lappa]|uniref:Uncharacterized protein n=1 Tax=Arctium lappa TaxID=4217 RepID=A0ACB9CIY6_ARCLA|nr:hypothetical protein L6452_13706 [Arctium lappa]
MVVSVLRFNKVWSINQVASIICCCYTLLTIQSWWSRHHLVKCWSSFHPAGGKEVDEYTEYIFSASTELFF